MGGRGGVQRRLGFRDIKALVVGHQNFGKPAAGVRRFHRDALRIVTVQITRRIIGRLALGADGGGGFGYGRGALFIRRIDQAIALDPKYGLAYNNRGNAWVKKEEYDRAIADYDQAIALDPKYARAYNNRGIARRATGDIDRALGDYDQAIALNPKYVEAYSNRGNVLHDKLAYDRAIADFDQAIELDPKYARAYVGRGIVWQAKGDTDRAMADYDQGIALDPKRADSYRRRGISFLFGDNAENAQADFAQAVEIAPGNPYHAIWLTIAKKANEVSIDAGATEKNLDMNKWPAPILKMLEGEVAPADVKPAAGNADQQCEAAFYVGADHRLSDQKEEAIKQYRAAVESRPRQAVELDAARLALRQLGAEQ